MQDWTISSRASKSIGHDTVLLLHRLSCRTLPTPLRSSQTSTSSSAPPPPESEDYEAHPLQPMRLSEVEWWGGCLLILLIRKARETRGGKQDGRSDHARYMWRRLLAY